MTATPLSPATTAGPSAWQRFSRAVASGFRRYAEWLVGISWKKFFLLSVLLLIAAALLSEIPPFSTRIVVSADGPDPTPKPASRAARAKEKAKRIGDVDIRIDETGIHIKRKRKAAPDEAEAPAAKTTPEVPGAEEKSGNPLPPPPVAPEAPAVPGALPTPPGAPKNRIEIDRDGITLNLPREAREEIRAAIQAARQGINEGLSQEDKEELRAAIEEAKQSIREAIDDEALAEASRPRTRVIRIGSYLPNLALLWIVASMVMKLVYAGRVKAEVHAAEAQETADAESLKRQVVEARLAAMQAQVEPHFLFNTLASIDHLIEVDPSRASTMQKNLIALLRASMPGMRESETSLGRELAVVRPYLEILRVRMGDRLQTAVNVTEGLNSADFPPMMLQSLVENAIKHGLEPKAEGGALTVGAEVVDGRLEVSVADTGVGFGRAATAGTGIGLSNIRERLKLLYGGDAELRIADNAPSGTRITIVVPYRTANKPHRA